MKAELAALKERLDVVEQELGLVINGSIVETSALDRIEAELVHLQEEIALDRRVINKLFEQHILSSKLVDQIKAEQLVDQLRVRKEASRDRLNEFKQSQAPVRVIEQEKAIYSRICNELTEAERQLNNILGQISS